MGYTSYFPVTEGTPDEEVWDGYRKALPILRDIAGRFEAILCADCYDPHTPAEVNEQGIFLNGKGDDGYEAFVFNPEDRGFQFCKTEKRPYDLPVCEMLLALQYHVPGLEIGSDGLYLDFEYDEGNGLLDGLEANWRRAIGEAKNRYGLRFRYMVKRTDAPHRKQDGSRAQYRKVALIPFQMAPPIPVWTERTLDALPPTPESAFFGLQGDGMNGGEHDGKDGEGEVPHEPELCGEMGAVRGVAGTDRERAGHEGGSGMPVPGGQARHPGQGRRL